MNEFHNVRLSIFSTHVTRELKVLVNCFDQNDAAHTDKFSVVVFSARDTATGTNFMQTESLQKLSTPLKVAIIVVSFRFLFLSINVLSPPLSALLVYLHLSFPSPSSSPKADQGKGNVSFLT